jgi:hypothetical protein
MQHTSIVPVLARVAVLDEEADDTDDARRLPPSSAPAAEAQRRCAAHSRPHAAVLLVAFSLAAVAVVLAAVSLGGGGSGGGSGALNGGGSCSTADDAALKVGGTGAAEVRFGGCPALASALRRQRCSAWPSNDMGMGGRPVAMAASATGGARASKAESSASAPASAGSTDFSGTNTQVADVDEADLLKTDGRFVFALSKLGYGRHQLSVVDTAGGSGGAAAAVVARLHLWRDYGVAEPKALLLSGGRLLLIARAQHEATVVVPPAPAPPLSATARGRGRRLLAWLRRGLSKMMPQMMPARRWDGRYSFSTTAALVFNVSGLAAAAAAARASGGAAVLRRLPLLRRVEVEGSFISARLVAQQALFAVHSYPHWYAWAYRSAASASAEDLLPLRHDSANATHAGGGGGGGGGAWGGAFTAACNCSDVRSVAAAAPRSFVVLSRLSLLPGEERRPMATVVAAGSGYDVFADTSSFFVAASNWNASGPQTAVMQFDFSGNGSSNTSNTTTTSSSSSSSSSSGSSGSSGGSSDGGGGSHLSAPSLAFRRTILAPGNLLNQFSMDSHRGHFRVATTSSWRVSADSWRRQTGSNVFVFDLRSGARVGALQGLAPGERIFASRFMGDRIFLVTFRQVDPLFAIDASDPARPRVLGQLKIPGYSKYLHPLALNGSASLIGFGEAADPATGRTTALKLSLFDVANMSDPRERFTRELGSRGSRSEALEDHKSFLFSAAKGNLVAFPATLYTAPAAGSPSWRWGAREFDGAVVMNVSAAAGFQLRGRISHGALLPNATKAYGRSSFQVRRVFFIGQSLLTLSDAALAVHRLGDLSLVQALPLFNSSDLPPQSDYGFSYVMY